MEASNPELENIEVSKVSEYPIPTDYLVEKSLNREKTTPTKSVVFNNEKQRNAQFIQKGITKPGRVSYETLRRAVNSVHIARICVNVLKEKVTKTKWVIQPIDSLKPVDENKIKKIEELFKHPNRNDETFRTLLDKMLEDLLVLDAVSLEKTRFSDGSLAELHFVDSATIRPVFDEHGNQDVEISIPTENGMEKEPVSYIQVLDNSQYGGPESGQVVAYWSKKNMVHFHMHPQGSMEGIGYGLSPIESVLSVVANILNADNFNGTYFEEGSFPPVILQLVGNMNERDLQAYREYLRYELEGNFHRPAIMAGATKAEVINLKDLSNRDMQFMEYMKFLARLLAAAYGLSGQDIGLTDDLNKAISETQKDLSESKGYGSVLHLLKEVFNQEIIWKDFGYTDIEFDWVVEDTVEPNVTADIYDKYLRNGVYTLNDVRQKLGETKFAEWADKPAILGSDGYVLIDPKEKEEKEDAEPDPDLIGNEDPYDDQHKKEVTKTSKKTLYISRPIINAEEIVNWAKAQGFKTTLPAESMHVTIAYSTTPVVWPYPLLDNLSIIDLEGRTISSLGDNGAVVLKFKSKDLTNRWGKILDMGASWDYKKYEPHITISYNASDVDVSKIVPFTGKIILGPESIHEVEDDFMDNITEKSRVNKSVYTDTGYKTWFDDRGYGQPFICVNILKHEGYVIKPPVAVNLNSQILEQELSIKLHDRGLNVPVVTAMTLPEVYNGVLENDDIRIQFDRYINMAPEYDSEKWRNKFGGSRKYPYYLVSEYVDGYCLNNPLLIADMKRDPASYTKAIEDLANLWLAEKELMLGDRRGDQYIISHDKRAWGFDYQFAGDKNRWESSSQSIQSVLTAVPVLLNMFNNLISEKPKTKKSIKASLKKLFKGLMVDDISFDANSIPVMFGELVDNDTLKEEVANVFSQRSVALLLDRGFKERTFMYDSNRAINSLKQYIADDPKCYGGVISIKDDRGIKFIVFTND